MYIYIPRVGSLNTLESGSLRSPINGSHYRASELIPLILLLFVCTLIEKKRSRVRQNNNYRAINLPKAI